MLNQDFRDMLSCLKSEGVEFIIVGAYALAAHGFPRATGDIDIWTRNDAESARRLMRALAKFGAPLDDLTVADLTDPDLVVQIGVEPSRIDLLTSIDGVSFDEAWQNKIRVVIDELELFVLAQADLLANKRAAGRDKDRGDIAWLEKNREAES
jgi:hypothetical protein